MVVVECGHRIHLTDFEIPITQTPSNFVTKLRKHLKTRRLSGLKQIGNDRVLVLQFSDGLYYLVLEFFSAGNIILLDENFKILSLNRLVQEKSDNDRYAVNETYKMFDKSLFDEKSEEFVHSPVIYTVETIQNWITIHKQKIDDSKSKKSKVFSIHKLLFANSSHLPADLILKNLIEVGINGSLSCLEFDNEPEKIEQLIKGLDKTESEFIKLTHENGPLTGFIVAKKNPHFKPDDNNENSKDHFTLEYIYDEFHPFKPYKEHEENYKFTPVLTYNKTLDTFFSTIESTKNALRIEKQKQQAANRLEHARTERDRQIQTLVQQQEVNMKKGDTIIYHADLVSSCCEMVQTLIDQQMDWTNIESFIKLEQSRNNSLANTIRLPLNLKENKINLLLQDADVEEKELSDSEILSSESESESDFDSSLESDSDIDSDNENSKTVKKPKKNDKNQKSKNSSNKISVWIDLTISPYANARLYFDTKKNAETKKHKVEKSTSIALKNAEKKITRDLKENLKLESEVLQHIRPKFWFEKFYWFVTSDGYLCLAGRDNSQIDMIYFRHFNDNDLFVSADIEGSLKVFIKNPFKGEDVPPSTLMQAGMFSISASSAWNGKAVVSAWVLRGDEISKKDFDETLVASGTFNYKGKKTFLPPCQLVMGFGFYFLADSETTKKYKASREARESEHGLKIIMDTKKQDLDIAKLKFKDKSEEIIASETLKVQEMKESKNETPEPEILNDSDEEGSIDILKGIAKNVRGKKAKMKKIATKYADQDEEERLLRMDALGTLKQIKQIEKQKEDEKAKELEKEKSKYEDSSSIQRKKKQDSREYLKYLMEEVNEDESSDTNYLEILDSFLEKPSTSDVFTGAVPVFAPWSALNKFKYKVKIQPGNGKKGKAVNDALNYFSNRKMDPTSSDTDLDWPKEREFINSIKPNDTMGVFTINKLKLVLPGGSSDSSKATKKAPQKKAGRKTKK